MQRAGSPNRPVDRRRLSSQRMLSLPSIGIRVGLILFLRAFVPLNFFRVQNLTAAIPSGNPVRRHQQARMHQQFADRVHAVTTGFVLAAAHLCREAHRLRTPAPPGKLRRVMKNEDRAIAGGEPAPSRVEMAPKNIFFAHPVVGEEAVGCLCVGPSLGKPAGCSLRTRLPFAPPVGEVGCPADRRQAGSRKAPRQTTDPP